MNWQNVPRDDKTIKRAVLPKRGALVFADYSQVEPRLTAYFAALIGYPEFAEKIRAGVDSYTAVAQLATGKENITPEERQVWKRIFLALVYGAGFRRVREVWIEETDTVISLDEARKITRTFHKNWPAVRALQDTVQAVALDRGYIRTPWGRQLHPEEGQEHKLLNKLIQGSAADLMKQAILAVDLGLRGEIKRPVAPGNPFVVRRPLDARMVSVIHDELILDAPIQEVDDLAAGLPSWMSSPAGDINEIVPITVDVEVSETSWADKIDYEEWKESQAAQIAA